VETGEANEYPMNKERKFDLQDRLIDYAVRIIKLSKALPDTKAGRHVSSQILRRGTITIVKYKEPNLQLILSIS
jgi:hypothetical protein